MRNLIFIVVVVAAIVVLCLYVFRIKTVPCEVKEALESDNGATITNMTQIPAAVKKTVENANRTADSNMSNALESIDK